MQSNSVEKAVQFGTEIVRGTFGPRRSFPSSSSGKRHPSKGHLPRRIVGALMMKCWSCEDTGHISRESRDQASFKRSRADFNC
jgi:hypothetical protein